MSTLATALRVARKHRDAGGGVHPMEIGTRLITSKKAQPQAGLTNVSMDSMRESPPAKAGGPGLLQKGADLSALRVARAAGGPVHHHDHKPAIRLHVGPIHSHVAGRTDHLPTSVPSGAYVLPADIVSHYGEGNSLAGFKVIKRMFSGTPYGGSGMPYGQNDGPYGQAVGHAAGGAPHGDGGDPVPCVLAGGEYVLRPDEVAHAGGGDLDAGHRALDAFVVQSRDKLIKTLGKLPGPRRD